jgi:hypothetical protein
VNIYIIRLNCHLRLYSYSFVHTYPVILFHHLYTQFTDYRAQVNLSEQARGRTRRINARKMPCHAGNRNSSMHAIKSLRLISQRRYYRINRCVAFVCRPQSGDLSRYLMAAGSSLMIKPLRMLGASCCASARAPSNVCTVVYQKASRSYRSGSILSFCLGWRRIATSARRCS